MVACPAVDSHEDEPGYLASRVGDEAVPGLADRHNHGKARSSSRGLNPRGI